MARNGLQITNNVSIPEAKDTDFVVNTENLGGMHYVTAKTFSYAQAQTSSQYTTPYTLYAHGLNYVPAFMAFGANGILTGIQSIANPTDTVIATANSLLILFGTGKDVTVIIFAEKLSDN